MTNGEEKCILSHVSGDKQHIIGKTNDRCLLKATMKEASRNHAQAKLSYSVRCHILERPKTNFIFYYFVILKLEGRVLAQSRGAQTLADVTNRQFRFMFSHMAHTRSEWSVGTGCDETVLIISIYVFASEVLLMNGDNDLDKN